MLGLLLSSLMMISYKYNKSTVIFPVLSAISIMFFIPVWSKNIAWVTQVSVFTCYRALPKIAMDSYTFLEFPRIKYENLLKVYFILHYSILHIQRKA